MLLQPGRGSLGRGDIVNVSECGGKENMREKVEALLNEAADILPLEEFVLILNSTLAASTDITNYSFCFDRVNTEDHINMLRKKAKEGIRTINRNAKTIGRSPVVEIPDGKTKDLFAVCCKYKSDYLEHLAKAGNN